MTRLFGQTLRENPSQADAISHQLLWRSGFIRPTNTGSLILMPLGKRMLDKLDALLCDALHAIGCQEVLPPPFSLTEASSGSDPHTIHPVQDIPNSLLAHQTTPSSSNDAFLIDLVKAEIQSYRQLPILLSFICFALFEQQKHRSNPHPRLGLLQSRFNHSRNAISLDREEADASLSFQTHARLLQNVFQLCDLPIKIIDSESITPNISQSAEFVYLTSTAEDAYLFCDHCGYASSQPFARSMKIPSPAEPLLPIEKVPTPNAITIADLSAFLEIPESKTAKAVFFMAETPQSKEPRFIFAVLRGDMDLNETKLRRAIAKHWQVGEVQLRLAQDAEISAVGAVPGYASPLSINRDKALLILDDLVPQCPNLVAGANIPGYHFKNVNVPRDFTADLVTDIATAEHNSPCPLCASPLQLFQGIPLAQIQVFDKNYSKKCGITYLDEQGQSQPVLLTSSSLDLERTIACVIEAHHDAKGMRLPISLAPYPIHLLLIPSKDSKVQQAADSLYHQLIKNNLPTLFDDRDERAGVKFNDADLIGLPIRLTISERTLAKECVEFKRRDQDEKLEIPLVDLIPFLKSQIHTLEASLINPSHYEDL